MRLNRINEMEGYILERGNVSLEELAEYYSVSINTVRRDIIELLKSGRIKKIYGGVMSATPTVPIPIARRERTNVSSKHTIGALAATLIHDNSTVFIDTGTTTVNVLPHLDQRNNVTIITNSLRVMSEIPHYPNLKLVSLGGFFDATTSSFIGTTTVESLSNLSFDIVLMSATCVSLERGLTINSYFEEAIKRQLVQQNRGHTALLADTDKYNKAGSFAFASFDDMRYIVTEKQPPQEYLDHARLSGAICIYPDHTESEG